MKQPVKNQPKERRTSDEQVKLYSTISPLLQSAFHEVKEFSKKKQDERIKMKEVEGYTPPEIHYPDEKKEEEETQAADGEKASEEES